MGVFDRKMVGCCHKQCIDPNAKQVKRGAELSEYQGYTHTEVMANTHGFYL